jgi:hypothetical protein
LLLVLFSFSFSFLFCCCSNHLCCLFSLLNSSTFRLYEQQQSVTNKKIHFFQSHEITLHLPSNVSSFLCYTKWMKSIDFSLLIQSKIKSTFDL